jgi:TctA family transporter
MNVLANLVLGFGVVLTPTNLLVALIGCVVGTAVGELPGLGPTATISLLLPVSVYLDRTSSIILMSGIYYGAMYGGSITSILIKIPGEAASVITCLDGYQMARRGRAGAALGVSAFGSFSPDHCSDRHCLQPRSRRRLCSAPLKRPPCSFSVCPDSGIGEGPGRALPIGLGLLLGTVGVDPSPAKAVVFDVTPLRDGFGIAVVAMGLFGSAKSC